MRARALGGSLSLFCWRWLAALLIIRSAYPVVSCLHSQLLHTFPPPQNKKRNASDGCVNTLTGYSGTFGRRAAGRLDRFSNQTAVWRAKGAVTRVSLHYSPEARCLQGVKVFYGPNPLDARLLGVEGPALEARELTLSEGEVFNKAQIKAGS